MDAGSKAIDAVNFDALSHKVGLRANRYKNLKIDDERWKRSSDVLGGNSAAYQYRSALDYDGSDTSGRALAARELRDGTDLARDWVVPIHSSKMGTIGHENFAERGVDEKLLLSKLGDQQRAKRGQA